MACDFGDVPAQYPEYQWCMKDCSDPVNSGSAFCAGGPAPCTLYAIGGAGAPCESGDEWYGGAPSLAESFGLDSASAWAGMRGSLLSVGGFLVVILLLMVAYRRTRRAIA